MIATPTAEQAARRKALDEMCSYWYPAYIAAAKVAFPSVTANHKLDVGWKLTKTDGTSHNGYYWPLVNGSHDLPVLHEATNWSTSNRGSCPDRPGDGLCLITKPAGVRHSTSGVVRSLGNATLHILVYPTDLARGGESGKQRSPWVIDVDSCEPSEILRAGFVVNLSVANLSRANLYRANLSRADLFGAVGVKAAYSNTYTRWPAGFVKPV